MMTNPAGRPVEIMEAQIHGRRTSTCPLCSTQTPTSGRFMVASYIKDDRVLPVCNECLARHAPELGEAVDAVNRVAETLGRIEWVYARQCINALHVVSKEVVAAAPPDEVRATAERSPGERRRAMSALISRAAYEVTELTVYDTIGTTDPYIVAEGLAGIIAFAIRGSTKDVPMWLQEMFQGLEAEE